MSYLSREIGTIFSRHSPMRTCVSQNLMPTSSIQIEDSDREKLLSQLLSPSPPTTNITIPINKHLYFGDKPRQIDTEMVTSNEMERRRRCPTLSKETSSPRKHPVDASTLSKSGPSPTSNKRRSSLVIDTKDERESERNYGDTSRAAVLAKSISPTSAAFSKLITNMRSEPSSTNKQRLQMYQSSPKNRSAIHGVASPKSKASPKNLSVIHGVVSPKSQASPKKLSAINEVASPKSRPNLVIDTAGNFPNDENSPRASPSLFQQSANKVGLLQRSCSNEASECDDNQGKQRQRQSRSPAAEFSKLQISPQTNEDEKTASQVSNFIDTLHQEKGITTTPRNTGSFAHLPPKSPSVARLASNHKYSSILKNARNVIAASPVARANAAAALSNVSPQSDIALRRKNFLQKAASGYKDSDSDSYDSSDDDSSYCSASSFSSNEVSTSTKKDVGEFIDTLNRKNEPKVEKDLELLSLKTKLNARNHEKETAVRKVIQEKTKCDPPSADEKKNEFTKVAAPQDYASKHNIKKDVMKSKLNARNHEKDTAARKVVQEKTKCDSPSADEKKNEFTKVAAPQDYASKHNIKKDVHYYAILSQIQKAVQSDNPALLMGKIFADAGKRGIKLAIVTELFKEEKRKAKVFEPVKGIRKNNMTKARVLAKEQLAAMRLVDHPAKKALAAQKKQSTSDNATSSKKSIVSVSPPKEKCVSAVNSIEGNAATSKEQLAAMTINVDHPAKKAVAVQKKQSTSDNATSSKKSFVSISPPKEKSVTAVSSVERNAATPIPKPSSIGPLAGKKASESKSNVSYEEIVAPPAQDVVNSEFLASVSSESKGAHYDAALMSEVEAKVKEVVRSATPSIEFGKVLADAKKRGLPATHLIRLYKQEREELTNAAVKAASLVVKPECDNEIESSKPEAEESKDPCPQKSAAGFSMKEKLTKDVENAVRSSNPSEMLGKILADAQSKGLPTEWLFELYTKERMQVQMQVQMATVAEQGAQPSASDLCSTESEVSDVVSELQIEASSYVATSATVQQGAHHAADVVDFFSKFSLQSESKEANADSSEKQNLASSESEVSQYEIVQLNHEGISSESDVSEVSIVSSEVGRLSLDEKEEVVATSSRNNNKVRFETVHADEGRRPVLDRLWKSPLQKRRLSRKKLNRGGKRKPIDGVAAAAALTQKRSLRGPRRTHLTQSTQERTKEHSGFLDIDFYSLYESTTCHAENEEIDKAPWEYRDVRQKFLYEKSVDCRNWFGSFESKRGNDRVSNPVVCPRSLQIPVTVIPESGDWNEDWYTTWKSRRDNPNNLVTFTEADIPSLSLNSSGTSSTSTTITESQSSDQSVQSSDSTYCRKKPVLIEIGNLVSVRFGGEKVSKVHPDYTSSLRRSRWRKKYMRGEFAFDAEM